jgi:hypothetical protein
MSTFLERFSGSDIVTAGPRTGLPRYPRQTERSLTAVGHRTVVRAALVHQEEVVQGEKLKAIDHLAREAMTGQAMLNSFKLLLSRGDLMAEADLQYFADMAKLGKGEIIADTIDTYCAESRSNR